MSKKLGISVSYLSAIENGLREVPAGFINKLGNIYHLSEKEKETFMKAEASSARKTEISLNSALLEQKILAFTLSRKLKELTPDECSKIMEYLEDKDHEK